MKKVLGILTLAGIAGAAFFILQHTSEAMPPPPLPVVRVVCDGNNTCCGNALAPTNFWYHVQVPGGPVAQVTRVDIGTDDGNINHYSNWIEPPGWTHQILTAPANQPDRIGCLPHGTLNVMPTGNCSRIIRFSTTTNPLNTGFDLGFDIDESAHEVHWKAQPTGNQAQWSKALGAGDGCVHGPSNTPPHTGGGGHGPDH